ncbi:MAG: universal stress protein [Bacteroidia bacterium]|nr:universal stress protein [Bacteroidia bacterium]
MKTLLAPTDFSESGNNAVKYAAHLAHSIKGKLIILHVGQIEGNTPEIPQMILSWEAVEKVARDKMHSLRDDIHRELGALEIECRYRLGSTTDEILYKSKKEHADLIVVGMNGHTELLDRIIGSVATELGRKSEKPVLIIPVHSEFHPYEKIVLGTDLSSISNQETLKPLKTLARFFESKIFVLNVRKSLEETPTESEVTGSIEVDQFLDGVKHVRDFKEATEIEEGIQSYAKEHKAELICLIAHHHSFWYRLTHETHTKKMMFQTEIPTLILH